MLVFDGQRLDQVTAEISRYAPLEVVILDPELRQLAVGGYFRTGDIDALLKTLASDFGIEVVWVEPKLVHLSMKSE
jgi:transmembrane sensor